LIPATDVDGKRAVLEPALLQHDADLPAIGRRPVVEIDHGHISFVRECSYLRLPKDLRPFPGTCRDPPAASRWDATPGAALEPDPHRSGIVHPQHRLLQEVILVERPERLDPHVALLACIERGRATRGRSWSPARSDRQTRGTGPSR